MAASMGTLPKGIKISAPTSQQWKQHCRTVSIFYGVYKLPLEKKTRVDEEGNRAKATELRTDRWLFP